MYECNRYVERYDSDKERNRDKANIDMYEFERQREICGRDRERNTEKTNIVMYECERYRYVAETGREIEIRPIQSCMSVRGRDIWQRQGEKQR